MDFNATSRPDKMNVFLSWIETTRRAQASGFFKRKNTSSSLSANLSLKVSLVYVKKSKFLRFPFTLEEGNARVQWLQKQVYYRPESNSSWHFTKSCPNFIRETKWHPLWHVTESHLDFFLVGTRPSRWRGVICVI